MDPSYLFASAADARERARLRTIEAVFDPATRRRLSAAGLGPGRRCLEVGPGAGSIMTWMCDAVGPAGHVTAVDLDPRFVDDQRRPNLEIVRGDVCALDLAPASFDLVHARYVLIHVTEPARALDRMLACLRPGGWLVVEEPDFAAARALAGDPADQVGFARVARACLHMFAAMGKDGALGARLPAWCEERGLEALSVELDAAVAPGDSGMASIMSQSTAELRATYVATGLATDDDIDGYLRLAGDPASAAVYYATVAVMGSR